MSSYNRSSRLAFPLLAACLLLPGESKAQGGSAVITLVMPVGARQLGMGETGIAVGYEDKDAPINSWRTVREPVDELATFLS